MTSKNRISILVENKEKIVTAIENVYMSKHKKMEIRTTMTTVIARDELGNVVVDAIKNEDGTYQAEISGYYLTELYNELKHPKIEEVMKC